VSKKKSGHVCAWCQEECTINDPKDYRGYAECCQWLADEAKRLVEKDND
jgi:hypothetical protein